MKVVELTVDDYNGACILQHRRALFVGCDLKGMLVFLGYICIGDVLLGKSAHWTLIDYKFLLSKLLF